MFRLYCWAGRIHVPNLPGVGARKFSLLSLDSEKKGKRKRIVVGLFCWARWTCNGSGWLVRCGPGRSSQRDARNTFASEQECEDSPDAGGDCDREKYSRHNPRWTRSLIVCGVGGGSDASGYPPTSIDDLVLLRREREPHLTAYSLTDSCL